MNIENSPETREYKERLSSDYERIRDIAFGIIDGKTTDSEDLKEKLTDEYVLRFAKINGWQAIRDNSEDLEVTDKKLAEGLARAVLSLH